MLHANNFFLKKALTNLKYDESDVVLTCGKITASNTKSISFLLNSRANDSRTLLIKTEKTCEITAKNDDDESSSIRSR